MAATTFPIPQRPIGDTTYLPDTPARAFLRGAQAGAVYAHYRRLLADIEGVLPIPEALARAFRLPQAVAASVQPANAPVIRSARVARRGAKTQGQIAAEAARSRARARAPSRAYRPSSEARRSVLNIPGIRARVGGPFAGGAVIAAGNEIIQIYVGIGEAQKEARRLGGRVYPGTFRRLTGRTGAASTRPLSRTAVPGRTGAGSTRPLSAPTIPGVAQPVPGRPVARPDTRRTAAPANAPERVPGRGPAPVVRPAPGRAPSPSAPASPARAPSPARSPVRLELRVPTPEELLNRALSPRAVPRLSPAASLARPLPATVRTAFPTTASFTSPPQGAPVSAPGLTPSNATALGFSTETKAEAGAEPESDPCAECKKVKKQQPKKQRCSNPTISRTRQGDIETIKRRIVCPQSRLR